MLTALHLLKNPEKAKIQAKFFKTGRGEYAEGDIFIGVPVPETRKIANKYEKFINIKDLGSLIKSQIHEERLLALLILIKKFEQGGDLQEDVMEFYLDKANIKYINNWDLVDVSCYKILGRYILKDISKVEILYNFTSSTSLWERRMAIVSTYTLIKNDIFDHTLNLSKLLLIDKHDLIHKAIGWMLREVGKRNTNLLLSFLEENIKNIKPITFSYATEKLKIDEKQQLLSIRYN